MTTTTEPAPREDAPDVGLAPSSPRPVPPKGSGWLGAARRGWRRLTSMRTALVLLFLLALASVPGSLLPQRPLNQAKVDRYFAEHPALAPALDRFGLFDVFAAPWFAAIYLLLFLSLVGCLVPRIRQHAQAARSAPPPAPRNLHALPESATYEVDTDPDEAARRARSVLRGWRVVTRREPGGVVTVAAEKGHLHETGNLVFHFALTALLIGIAVGRVWGYQGTVLVEEGKGFCNSVALYDSFRPGRLVSGDDLTPFCVDRLENFTARYEPDGTPASFRADITYTTGVDGVERTYPLEVNRPLRLDGVRAYLVSHGFSPRFTVRTPSGQVFRDVSAPFLPQNAQLLSEGVVKLPDARPRQLALYGLFAPTAIDVGGGELASFSARPAAPAVAIVVYRGNLGIDSGVPQSVYTVDEDQVERGALEVAGRKNLAPGQSLELADGTRISFDGYREWASLQVSRDPGQTTVFGAAVFVVLGLLLSLAVRRRRLWLRLSPDPVTERDKVDTRSRTLVAVGGLARTDAGSFTPEFARLVERLATTAPATKGS